MKTFRMRHQTRAYRLESRSESRCALALIMLISLATVSVMATTQALSSPRPAAAHIILLR